MPTRTIAGTGADAGGQMRLALCLGAGLLAALAGPGAAALPAALRSEVEVDAPTITLADVLKAGTSSQPLPHRLTALALWAAPAPCRSVNISPAEMAARLRELRVDPGLAGMDSAGLLVIHRVCQRVGPAQLQAAARQPLAAWLHGQSERYELEPVDIQMAPVELSGRQATLVARPMEGGRVIAPRMQVWVDAFDGERIVRSVPVTFAVHAYAQAWVASRDLHVDQPVLGSGLERQEVDLAAFRGKPAPADLGEVRLRRPLLAGEVLTVAHLGADGVRSGSRVTARSRIGAIDVEASAQALQDGRAGQVVWVRVAGATSAVQARVIDKTVVEVERD